MAGIERVVTDEAVFAVADNLVKEGKKPTNRAIWDVIGGGSMTTISAALRKWKERQELQVEQPIERASLPPAIEAVLHNACSELWQAAMDETKAELEQLAQASNSRVTEANEERDEVLAELQATAEELEQARAEIARSNLLAKENHNEIDRLRTNVENNVKRAEDANHRANTSEAARTELKAQVAQLTAMLEHEQAAHNKADAEAKALYQQCADLRAKFSASEKYTQELEKRTATAEQQYTQEKQEAAKARIQEKNTQSKLESANDEIIRLQEQLQAERAAAKLAGELAAELKGKLSALEVIEK